MSRWLCAPAATPLLKVCRHLLSSSRSGVVRAYFVFSSAITLPQAFLNDSSATVVGWPVLPRALVVLSPRTTNTYVKASSMAAASRNSPL